MPLPGHAGSLAASEQLVPELLLCLRDWLLVAGESNAEADMQVSLELIEQAKSGWRAHPPPAGLTTTTYAACSSDALATLHIDELHLAVHTLGMNATVGATEALHSAAAAATVKKAKKMASIGEAGMSQSSTPPSTVQQSRAMIKDTGELVSAHLTHYLHGFPGPGGAACVGTILTEGEGAAISQADDLWKALQDPRVQMFAYGDNKLVSVVELEDSVKVVLRDVVNRHVWMFKETPASTGALTAELGHSSLVRSPDSRISAVAEAGVATAGMAVGSSLQEQATDANSGYLLVGDTPQGECAPHNTSNEGGLLSPGLAAHSASTGHAASGQAPEDATLPLSCRAGSEFALQHLLALLDADETTGCAAGAYGHGPAPPGDNGGANPPASATRAPTISSQRLVPLLPVAPEEMPELTPPPSNARVRRLLFQLGLASWGSATPTLVPLAKTEKSARMLWNLDSRSPSREQHKFGVIYIGPTQMAADDILSSTASSAAFEGFVDELGWSVALKTHPGYTGRLKDEQFPGCSLPYYATPDMEVIFHVHTRMLDPIPNTKPTEVTRDRWKHIGNASVNIVWLEDFQQDFSRLQLKTRVVDLSIVICPLPTGMFRVQLIRAKDNTITGAPLFDGAIVNRSVLGAAVRATAINAGRTLRRGLSPSYQSRAQNIQDVISKHSKAKSFEDFTCSLVARDGDSRLFDEPGGQTKIRRNQSLPLDSPASPTALAPRAFTALLAAYDSAGLRKRSMSSQDLLKLERRSSDDMLSAAPADPSPFRVQRTRSNSMPSKRSFHKK